MSTNLSTPEREAAADKSRLEAMKGGTLSGIRVMVNEEEGRVIPLNEAEGKKVLAFVRELYSSRKPKTSRKH
jgi:hypothetical protein